MQKVPYERLHTCHIPEDYYNTVKCVTWANLAKCVINDVSSTIYRNERLVANVCMDMLDKLAEAEKSTTDVVSTTGHAGGQ